MKVIFTKVAWEDLVHFIENDAKTVKKIKTLIESIKKSPFEGLGKPEALKYEFTGCYSRRTNREHRLVYKIIETPEARKTCYIIPCRYHC